jgi:hypothetical protein
VVYFEVGGGIYRLLFFKMFGYVQFAAVLDTIPNASHEQAALRVEFL